MAATITLADSSIACAYHDRSAVRTTAAGPAAQRLAFELLGVSHRLGAA